VTTRNWKIHPVIATAIAINAGILGLALAWSGDAVRLGRLLTEDGMVEWMQFLCFAVISVLLGYAAIDRFRRTGRVSLAVLGLAGLSLLVALAAGEEISWFQRVLGVDSPEFFRQNNKQSETNLHNLALGGASLHKVVLLKLIFIMGILHNLVLPLLARTRPALKRFIESLGLYLPPLSASLVYLLLVLLSHLLIKHERQGELGEMFGAVHYLSTVFAAYYLGLGYGGPKVIDGQADGRHASALFSLSMAFLLFVGWLLGAGYLRGAAL